MGFSSVGRAAAARRFDLLIRLCYVEIKSMSHYKRWYRESGTYFFTVVTHRRQKLFNDGQARDILREAIGWVRQRHPFEIVGMALLAEHLHAVWQLPHDDSDFSRRWK